MCQHSKLVATHTLAYHKSNIDTNSIQITGGQANHVPHFMIFTDESTKSVVLAIKGTDNANVKLYIPNT